MLWFGGADPQRQWRKNRNRGYPPHTLFTSSRFARRSLVSPAYGSFESRRHERKILPIIPTNSCSASLTQCYFSQVSVAFGLHSRAQALVDIGSLFEPGTRCAGGLCSLRAGKIHEIDLREGALALIRGVFLVHLKKHISNRYQSVLCVHSSWSGRYCRVGGSKKNEAI